MVIRFWGVRAQVATPGFEYVRFGGNTPCIEVRDADDNLLILDAGTGLPSLGGYLFSRNFVKPGVEIPILLSDTRWDHTQGFPFFGPCYVPGVLIKWYGPANNDQDFKRMMSGSMTYSYFPIRLDELRSEQTFQSLTEEEFTLGNFRVRTLQLNTEQLSLGYRIEADNRILIHIPGYEENDESFFAKLVDFCADADMIVHDAYFAWRKDVRGGWGRASIENGIRLSEAVGVESLTVTGYRPSDADDVVDGAARTLLTSLTQRRSLVDLRCAREGLTSRV